jgi:pimeloyl-ACP methyl ester carboxylesterase
MSRTRVFLLSASAIVVAASTAIYGLYSTELARARVAVESGSQIATTALGVTEYAEKGAGVPLLSIHGAGGGFDQGLANVAELVGDGFRVIAPSRFGYLRTPVPGDFSAAAQAEAHAALLAELDVPNAIVVGISAGARSAVELAIRHPQQVAAVILIVPAGYSPDNPVTIEDSRTNEFAFQVVNAGADFAWWAAEKLAPSVLLSFLGVKPELVWAAPRAEQDRVMSIVRSVEPLSQRVAGINIDSNPDFPRPDFEAIRAPTLVITARDDLFNTLPAAEFAAQNIANAKLVVYDSGGHLLVGRGPEVRKVVRDFLTEIGLSPPLVRSDAVALSAP